MLALQCNCRYESDSIQEVFSSIALTPKKEQFKAFHFLFQRPYDLNSEEGLNRYRIFKSNLRFISETNSKNLGYTLGINQFADLTLQEYKNTYLNNKIEEYDSKFENGFMKSYLDDDDDDFVFDKDENYPNWESIMPEARNQKGCGSCWAFSTLGALEGSYSIKFGKKINLSRQDIVDCDTKNYACDGGVTEWALDYLKANGVTYENLYGYNSGFTAERGVCKKDIKRLNILQSYKGGSGTSDFNALLAKGPLKVNMDAGSKEFVFYQSGVINLPCDGVNHGVVAIGRGKEEGKEYIYIRNSHGKNWGTRGNIKVQVNKSNFTCFIEKSPYLLEVTEASFPEPPAPEKSCLLVSNNCGGKGETFESCNTATNIPFKNLTGLFSAQFNKFEGRKISFFTEKDCGGARIDLDDDNSCSKLDIKSFLISEEAKPPGKCVWIYENSCFSGKKYEICEKKTDLKAKGYVLGSFYLGSEVKSVKLYAGLSSVSLSSSNYRLFDYFYQKATAIELNF